MKQTIFLLLALLLFTACHESLEDRAAREAKEFTEKNCPTPVQDYTRTDSLVFDKTTRTMNYYYTLCGEADNPAAIKLNKQKMHDALKRSVINATNLKKYKDAGFKFRYVYYSESKKGTILFEDSFSKADLE